MFARANVMSGEVFGSPAVTVTNGKEQVVRFFPCFIFFPSSILLSQIALALDEDMRDDWESEIEDTIFQAGKALTPTSATSPMSGLSISPNPRGGPPPGRPGLGSKSGAFPPRSPRNASPPPIPASKSGQFSSRGGPPPVSPRGSPPLARGSPPLARGMPLSHNRQASAPPEPVQKKVGLFGKLFGSGNKMHARSASAGSVPPKGSGKGAWLIWRKLSVMLSIIETCLLPTGPLPPPPGAPPKNKKKVVKGTGIDGY